MNGNSRINGTALPVKTAMAIALALLQLVLGVAAWGLYDQIRDINRNIVETRETIANIRLEVTRDISGLRERIGILERTEKP